MNEFNFFEENPGLKELFESLDMFNFEGDFDEMIDLSNKKARQAIRKDNAKRNKKIYLSAVDSAEPLNYDSSRYIIPLTMGLANDGLYTLGEPIKKIYHSPLVQGMLRESFGEDISLDSFFSFMKREATQRRDSSLEKELDELQESLKDFSGLLEYPKHLGQYAEENSLTPEEVLNSPADKLEVVERTHGSLENYEAGIEKKSESLLRASASLGLVNYLPLGSIFSKKMSLSSIRNDIPLGFVGINPDEIGEMAQDYVRDVAKIGENYMRGMVYDKRDELSVLKRIKEHNN